MSNDQLPNSVEKFSAKKNSLLKNKMEIFSCLFQLYSLYSQSRYFKLFSSNILQYGRFNGFKSLSVGSLKISSKIRRKNFFSSFFWICSSKYFPPVCDRLCENENKIFIDFWYPHIKNNECSRKMKKNFSLHINLYNFLFFLWKGSDDLIGRN